MWILGIVGTFEVHLSATIKDRHTLIKSSLKTSLQTWHHRRIHMQINDLNPIENCWNWMKRQLKEINITNLEQMKKEVLNVWCIKMADGSYLRALVESMPRRLAAVIENEGEMTKY